MQSQFFFYVDMQGKGAPLPLQPIPKTKNNNKTKTKNKIKVVYTENLTDPAHLNTCATRRLHALCSATRYVRFD